MSKFNSTSKGKGTTRRTLSKDGVSAWETSACTDLCDRVLTSFFGEDRFYETGKESSDNIIALIHTVAKEKPKFVAKLAILAREEFNLRSVSQVIVAELSKVHKGDSLVSDTLERIAKRPDDLTEIVAYLLKDVSTSKDINGRLKHKNKKLPNSIKKGISKAIIKFDEYQWSKYYGNGKDVKLIDLLKLVHPKPINNEQSDMWRRAIQNKLKPADTWERKLSESGQGVKTEVDKLIAKKECWESLIKSKKIGYMALLRNIRNIIEVGVSEDVHEMVQNYLGNETAVLKSKQLPFRFYSAYKAIVNERQLNPYIKNRYLNVLGKAMSYSAKNIMPIKGRTLLATDLSGSMNGKLSNNSDVSYKEVGAVLSALANQFCDESILCGFGTNFDLIHLSDSPTEILNNVSKIMNTDLGYSTNASLIMQYLLDNNIKVDQIILFSDMQLNGSYTFGLNSLDKDISTYRKRINKNVRIYELNLAGYGSSQINPNDSNYVHMSGWSDNTLKYITEYQSLKTGIIDMVNKVSL